MHCGRSFVNIPVFKQALSICYIILRYHTYPLTPGTSAVTTWLGATLHCPLSPVPDSHPSFQNVDLSSRMASILVSYCVYFFHILCLVRYLKFTSWSGLKSQIIFKKTNLFSSFFLSIYLSLNLNLTFKVMLHSGSFIRIFVSVQNLHFPL